MNRIVTWFAENSVAANLLFAFVLVAGLVTLPTIRQEVFPEFETDRIVVFVLYPGAAPADVEEGVCVRIEEEIQGIDGVRRIVSTAVEGLGTVTVEVRHGADPKAVLDEVKSRVDGIDTFPAETERPVVRHVVFRRHVIQVAVSGRGEEATLKEIAERVRDDLAALPEISHTSLANVRPYEISIEVAEANLRQHGIAFDHVVDAVRRFSLDLPGGEIRTEAGEILLRTKGQAYRGPDFERIPILTHPDGTRLTVSQVARVVDGFEETDQRAHFDGEPMVLVQVFRTGEESALEVAAAVHRYVGDAEAWLPEGIRLTPWMDDARVLRSRLDTLLRNALAGFLLVLIVLALFLRLRLAFWVSLSIPISFLGALWLMPTFGVSINMISLFAFIVVLGILVDDAIIVGENVHTHETRHPNRLRASIEGTLEVATPVTFGVLTTIAAFVPLFMVPGVMGQIWAVVPIVVITALVFSLLECFFVLPAHLAMGRSREGESRLANPVSRGWRRFQGRFTDLLGRVIRDVYRPGLEFALRWRYAVLAAMVALLLWTASFVGGGWIRLHFFPPVEADFVVAALAMPLGTPAEVTEQAVRQLEESAAIVRAEIDRRRAPGKESVMRHVMASLGEQPYVRRQRASPAAMERTDRGGHLAEVLIELVPSEERRVTGTEVANLWRERTGPIPGVAELTFTSTLFTAGDPIHVQLAGRDLDTLRSAAEVLKERLSAYPGVFDVSDSFREGKEELELRLRPSAEATGLTLSDLGRQVRQAFYGEEAQRVQRGRDDIRVMVRYPEEDRRRLSAIEGMNVRLPDGTEIPFAAVAEVEWSRGFAAIERADRRRTVDVTADVDVARTSANEVFGDLRRRVLPEILEEHSGVTYTFEGEQREQTETLAALYRGFLLALGAIYVLLAVPLRSYVQPFLIVSVIPFGAIGAVAGHILMGHDLSIVSVMGMVALAGVVVNDSLVLVTKVNRLRADGVPIDEAIRGAGEVRFRPVVLTSLTTFAGLTPLLLEQSVQAQFLMPMAISLGFGILFATVLSLCLVPLGYQVLEDVKRLGARVLPSTEPSEPDAAAAGRS